MRQIHIKEWTAVALLTCGVILAFVSLLMPPPGEIHESVLYIFAQILIYAGSIFGIDAYIRKVASPRPSPKEREKEECDVGETL